jgi:hypothetical protein
VVNGGTQGAAWHSFSFDDRGLRLLVVLRFALVKGASMAVLDISAQFFFRKWTQGNFSYKEASGELGVPGKVAKHRIVAAQTSVSSRTGDHAGHLIGIQFGAPGDLRNLGLQNANMNTFAPKALQPAFQGHGGSYHDLESRWSEQLKQGSKIKVTVRDKYRKGENRPFSRWVQWIETKPGASGGQAQELEFGNFSSPQQRAANQ